MSTSFSVTAIVSLVPSPTWKVNVPAVAGNKSIPLKVVELAIELISVPKLFICLAISVRSAELRVSFAA